MQLFVIARHGQSALNLARRVNGDPSVEVELTEQGVEESCLLGAQLANIPFDACVHTRFGRTRRTVEIVLGGRAVSLVEEPLLDDIDVGELEGQTIERYREWKRAHGRNDPFPGGESLDAAARRYSKAYRRLLAAGYRSVLVVTHEIPLRYALNAAAGSDHLDGPAHEIPNATPYVFDEHALGRAVAGIERLAGSDR